MNLDREQTLAWYQTTVFRAALLAMLIVFGGYLGSVMSLRQALQGFASMVNDAELADALDSYMNTLKQLDGQVREAILTSLQKSPPPEGWSKLSREDIEKRLLAAGITELSQLSEITIETEGPSLDSQPLRWLSRNELQLDAYHVHIPGSEFKARFDEAEALKQRYALIQATWDKEIAPSLLLTQVLIFVATVLSIGLVLFLLVRRYIADAQIVLRGLRRWSESDSAFRLALPLSGELGVIATQFNLMADEVESNRRRSLSLEKIASWQTMARKLAHEIKNPLTPIQMMVAHVHRSYKGDDPEFKALLGEAAAVITEEVKALRNMVDHFSQFARLPDPVLAPADLHMLCQQVIDLQAMAFPQHKLSYRSTLPSAPVSIDSQLIRQLLSNLIKNAAEASSERQSHIEISLDRWRSTFRIEVKDDGPGIPELDLNRIFEAYFTTKHTGPSPGMGLGLAICQKIAFDHAGDLKVRSQAGETVFTLYLPAADQAP